MVSPAGKKLILGKDVTIDDLKKFFAKKLKTKKKPAPKPKVRKLGPGVVIPAKFLEAQDLLVKKLITDNKDSTAGKKTKQVGRENILGIHIGQKQEDGEPTGSLAVVVTVRKKVKNAKTIHPKYRIPNRIKVKSGEWIPVDVKRGYDVKPHAIGGQLCTLDQTGPKREGAIGCFCYMNLTKGHVDLLLTNNHVIGRFANGKPSQDTSSDNVFDTSGNVIAGDPVMCGSLDASDGLSIDAAIGTIGDRNPAEDSNRHMNLQFSGTIKKAAEGDTVTMFGAHSGIRTTGRVRRLLAFKDVDYTSYPIGRHISIRGVFEITPTDSPTFSIEGDSGSVIISADGNPVGILIGGGNDENGAFSLAADLATVQADLQFDGICSVP